MPSHEFIVIDQRNGSYAIAAKADDPLVDFVYVEHLGGMTKSGAIALRQQMNKAGKPVEPECDGPPKLRHYRD